jgi:hypothetical protein
MEQRRREVLRLLLTPFFRALLKIVVLTIVSHPFVNQVVEELLHLKNVLKQQQQQQSTHPKKKLGRRHRGGVSAAAGAAATVTVGSSAAAATAAPPR